MKDKLLAFREDGTVSRYGSPATSVCTTCHGAYLPHGSGKEVGCLDCHDEHGEGANGNASMIVASLPPDSKEGEKTVFAAAKGGDFYRADGAGICDNALCHGGVKSKSGTAAAPLKSLMESGGHGGGGQAPGTDCRVCHRHDSPGDRGPARCPRRR